MHPTAEEFNPLPAAACLPDPSLLPDLLEPDQADLLHAAEAYVIHECECDEDGSTERRWMRRRLWSTFHSQRQGLSQCHNISQNALRRCKVFIFH